jgi:transposase
VARRGRPCIRLTLNIAQRTELQRRVRAGTSCQRDGLRARIILASEEGDSAAAVARRVVTHPRTVERWRDRFRRHGVPGLQDIERADFSGGTRGSGH